MPASDFAELLPGGKAGIVYEQLPTNAQQQKLVQRQTLEALLEYDIPVQDDVIQQIRADDAVQRNGYVFRSTESYCATIARRFLTNRDDRACMRMLKNEYTRRVFLQQKGALETLSRLGGVSAALRLWGIGAVLRFSAIAIASYIGCRIAYPVLSIIPTFLAGIWTCNFFLKDSLDGNKKKQEKLVKLVAAKCSDLK
jgi:hypothetical protein